MRLLIRKGFAEVPGELGNLSHPLTDVSKTEFEKVFPEGLFLLL